MTCATQYKALPGFDPYTSVPGRSPMRRRLKLLPRTGAPVLAKAHAVQWIAEIENARRTTAESRYRADTRRRPLRHRMRELVGADAAACPADARSSTTSSSSSKIPRPCGISDPNAIPRSRGAMRELTPSREKLAIDINIVERYQDVYPTKQQTGVELLQLVQVASKAFDRVALYFENSISKSRLEPAAVGRSGREAIRALRREGHCRVRPRRWSRMAGRRKGEWSPVALDRWQDRLAPKGLIRDRTRNVHPQPGCGTSMAIYVRPRPRHEASNCPIKAVAVRSQYSTVK